jgi:hypothetical protein
VQVGLNIEDGCRGLAEMRLLPGEIVQGVYRALTYAAGLDGPSAWIPQPLSRWPLHQWYEFAKLGDLFLEFDHLEFAAHRQLLEAFELGQPLQFIASLLGHFGFGLFLRGHVSRSRENAQHLAPVVLVNRRVVKHVGEPAILMTDG